MFLASLTKSHVLGGIATIGLFACAQLQAAPTILTNHIGYESKGWKQAVIKGVSTDQLKSCTLRDAVSQQELFAAAPIKTGSVDQWRDWNFWTWEFTSVEQPGQYLIECTTAAATVRSFPFVIEKNLLEHHTLSDVLYYFKGQRASGLLDKADRKAIFADHADKAPVDVRGGWYDATGDYSKTLSHLEFSTYFNPQQTPLVVLNLFRVYDKLSQRKDQNFTQYRHRLLDEALYGADFLVRMKAPNGSFYRNVAGLGATKAPEDRRLVPGMKGFALKDNKNADWKTKSAGQDLAAAHSYEVSYRGGGGIAIAALAIASQQTVAGDFTSANYLQAAEEAFAFLEQHNASLTNDGKENIVDDYTALIAATELYKATQKKPYQAAAAKRATALVKRISGDKSYQHYWRADDKNRPFFHAADAGFPVVSLLTYHDIATPKEQKAILAAVRKSMEFELNVTQEVNNPFGYARQYVQNKDGKHRSSFFYPHDTETAPWWQGENARLGSLATAARMTAAHFPGDKAFAGKLETYAWNQLNWILGLNPFDASMLNGEGRNNVQYIFFESYEYTNAPGGIVNGITSGLDNERDIDLNRGYQQTGKDNDWRWAEQWLPHGAWYILAIAQR